VGAASAFVAELPADAVVLLVGPSGAGKSTWAAAQFPPDQVLASDDYRAMVAGDAADQSATADAFKVLHVIVAGRVRRGLRCVIDATNLTTGARRSLLGQAWKCGRPSVAVVFDLSLRRCLAQNAARAGRVVPEAVVRRQHEQLQAVLDRLHGEGFAGIETLHDADIEVA
jgi:predicted kinase